MIISCLVKEEKNLLLFENGMFVSCDILGPLHQRIVCVSLVEIGPVVLEKKILKFCHCIFAISLLYPLGKECGPSLRQT